VSSCKRDTETNGFEFRIAMNFDEYCLTQVLALPCAGLSSLLESFAERGFVYDSFLSKEPGNSLRLTCPSANSLSAPDQRTCPADFPSNG
jgi:hypothetical protein